MTYLHRAYGRHNSMSASAYLVLYHTKIDFSIVTLKCGGSASENQTYIYQASATKISSPCTHRICPLSSNICRIRYDFKVSQLICFLVLPMVNRQLAICPYFNYHARA